MNANPLVNAASQAAPAKADKDKRVVSLVCNAPADRITGLDDFLKAFNSGNAHAEVSHFRYVIQRRTKRSLGGKFAQGLSTEVTENIEINLNEDLFGLRRWLATIRQDPGSVMLLNIFKIKEDALAAPLIFSDMLRTGRPLLVTGADASMQSQLTATPDLQFKVTPPEIEGDTELKLSFLARPQRRKGFVQTVRNLMEFEFLPQEVRGKIQEINTGGDPSVLNEAETINLCLLSDISSRYRPVLDQYKKSMQETSLQVPQLMSMFEIVTADLPVNHAVAAFKNFLEEDAQPAKLDSKTKLFANIYRYLSTDKDDNRMGRMDRMSRFHKVLLNVVVRNRMRVDPFLWKRCYFLGERDPGEIKVYETVRPYFRVLSKAIKAGEEGIGEEFKRQTAMQMFELLQQRDPSNPALSGEHGGAMQRAANRLLNLMGSGTGSALDKTKYFGENGKMPAGPDELMKTFEKLPLSIENLRLASGKLKPVLFLNEVVAAEIQRSTLDVMKTAAKERDSTLRDIYILNAVSELTNFTFHVGDKRLTNLERVCGMAVAGTRLGLEFNSAPINESSIGLYVNEQEPPPGRLVNDSNLLRLAYTELVGMRVERLVKRAVDHKINYLQTTFGKNFFEVIYARVVIGNNLPLSRNQFAEFIRRRTLMGNLDAKGWQPTNENALADPFLLFADSPSEARKQPPKDSPLEDFEKRFDQVSREFKQLLNETKISAEKDGGQSNPNTVLWDLFKQGIYNLSRPEAKAAFRKSVFFKYLQELIAKISSENYSTFTAGIVDGGIKIFIPWKFNNLQLIGDRFGFLVGDRVVKYQMLSSPSEKPEELDDVSRVLYLQLEAIFSSEERGLQVQSVLEMGAAISKTTRIWTEYSRFLSVAMMDRALSETVIKQLEPGKIQVQHLLYLPDPTKLCLGKAVVSTDSVPFTKLLQAPDNMGNVVKNPKSSSTTIDDFTIQVHSLGRLRDELEHYAGIAEDARDILQNLAHDKAEGPAIAKYEQALQQMITVLSKPLRHISEKDVQALHVIAKQVKEMLYTLYNSPSPQKQKITLRLQAELQSRRSDGHQVKLNFADEFIIDTTEIKVLQKVKQGDEVVKKQKKIEVEVAATHQTLSLRMREVIRTQAILQRKRHIVFSPEGQKKKQVEYTMDIIDLLQALRGNALTFYADTTQLAEEQVHRLAARVKPHNFFVMEALTPEKPEGLKSNLVIDPLSGRPIAAPPGSADSQSEQPN